MENAKEVVYAEQELQTRDRETLRVIALAYEDGYASKQDVGSYG